MLLGTRRFTCEFTKHTEFPDHLNTYRLYPEVRSILHRTVRGATRSNLSYQNVYSDSCGLRALQAEYCTRTPFSLNLSQQTTK